MRTASLIFLVIIALLLLYIANEVRKGKSVVFVFGNFKPTFDVSTATVDRVTPQVVIQNAVQDISNGYSHGLTYGKSLLEDMTGWKTK